ncbi:MAG: NAD-dependent epimerase/dehydratase family protein [Pseudomonadota bacterium]
MRILLLGGTGSIGTAVVRELVAAGHHILALSRSETSDGKLTAAGAAAFRGDLREPEDWAHMVASCAAVVQVAATFEDDMGEVDRRLVDALLAATTGPGPRRRFLYTGGCWLYGATGEDIATEDGSFNPLSSFAWAVENGERLLRAGQFSTAILHPAMVYHEEGGVFERFVAQARSGEPLEIWGSPDTRWPLVHRDDLAVAYRLLLGRPELTGHFNVAAEEGVRVKQIATAIAGRYGSPKEFPLKAVDDLVAEHGAWAEGPTLDQQMSAAKLRQATGWAAKVTDFTQAAPCL